MLMKRKNTIFYPLYYIFQLRGISNDLKYSTPVGCGFKSSPV